MDVDAEIQVHEDVKASSSASEACNTSAASSTSSEVKIPPVVKAPKLPVEVEVRVTDTPKGKCLFAVSAIPADTIIFEEDPFVCCQLAWNRYCGYLACDHCLRPLEIVEANVVRLTKRNLYHVPYPEFCKTNKFEHKICPDCMVPYCSEYCLKTAYQEYHETICPKVLDMSENHPYAQLEKQWRLMHYPPETTTIFLLVRLIARIIQAPNKQQMVQKILNFCHKSTNEHEELSHKFLGDKFKEQLFRLRMLISRLFSPEQYSMDEVQQFLTSEGFQTLIALIGTNAQGVATSPFSAWLRNAERHNLPPEEKEEMDEIVEEIYEYMEKAVGLEFLDNEGIALYVKQSSVNHSCDPNAETKFWNNNYRLSLVALRDIEPGEEICMSYLDECQLNRSRHSRRKHLKENYLFVCLCPKCELQCDDPDVTSEEEMSADQADD